VDALSRTEMKQVIILRKDLGMSPGKAVAQGAHASVGAYHDSMGRWGPIAGDMIEPWTQEGKMKIVLAVPSEKALLDLAQRCDELNIGCYLVRDSGRTEVDPGTYTALGIGPDFSRLINKLTLELELY